MRDIFPRSLFGDGVAVALSDAVALIEWLVDPIDGDRRTIRLSPYLLGVVCGTS
jgi:hypothetical protein